MGREFPYEKVVKALESEFEKVSPGESTNLNRLMNAICDSCDVDETTKLAIMDFENWDELEAFKVSREVESLLAKQGVLLYPAGFFDPSDEMERDCLVLLRSKEMLAYHSAPREFLESSEVASHLRGIRFNFTFDLLGSDSIVVRISDGRSTSRIRSFRYRGREKSCGPLKRMGAQITSSFLSSFERSGALRWGNYYQDACDGYGWSLFIEFDNGFVKKARGSNDRPKGWKALMRSLRKVGFISALH